MVKKVAVLALAVSLLITCAGCNSIQAGKSMTEGVPSSEKYTTLAKTYVPIAPKDTANPPKPNEVADFEQKGYGLYKNNGGLNYAVRLDLLNQATATNIKSIRKLLSFFTMSDVHITDIQSPAQALIFGKEPSGKESAYCPSIVYSTQVLDAAVKSVNKIDAANKLDFGLMLGDAINNAQQNELTMYLDVLTGRMVYPNSDMGNKSGTDYTQPFKAEGLNVPWYQVLGNHDHFWSGVYNANDKLKKALLSDKIMKIGALPNSRGLIDEDVYPGIIDVSDPYGKIIGAGKEFQSTDIIAANITRSFMDSQAFSAVFPQDHGINESSLSALNACYTFEPKADVPVRVIVLDDTASQDTRFVDATKAGDKFTNAAFGSLDKDRFSWFVKQLADADKANKLVIVAAHIPLGVGLWDFTSEISEKQVIAELQKYSNIALVTAGHRHINTVTAFKSPEPAKPEFGFWQVETASLRDFPQQFRIYDLALNEDNTISVNTTNVDPEETACVIKSRSYAIAAKQIFNNNLARELGVKVPEDASGAYNAVLSKKITPDMAKILKKANVTK